MPGESLDPYEAILYILLHDVGKPLQRLAKRYVEGIERSEDTKELMERVTGKSVNELAKTSHEEISRTIVGWILGRGLSTEARRRIYKILARVDALAAAERGFEVVYKRDKAQECLRRIEASRLLERVSEKLSEIIGSQVSYGFHTSPLLSPLWPLLVTDYLDYVGVRAYAEGRAGRWRAEEASRLLRQKLSGLMNSLERCDVNAIVDELAKLLAMLLDEEVWLTVTPITPKGLELLKAMKYLNATRSSSYSDVVRKLFEMLGLARDIYGSYPQGTALQSLIDTLLAIMRPTLLLVPSAVYASIVPDIGLYSHSKVVTAYAASELLGRVTDRYRLLLIDTNGIQQFISAPIKAAAASRVLRGKSLIVELAVDSLTRYVLEVFDDLPDANVLTSEGGVVEVIVPDVDVEKRVSLIERVAENLSTRELGLGLGFTIAYSDPFDSSKARFIHVLGEEKGYTEVLSSLTYNLALRKAQRGVRSGKVYAKEDRILGFDVITGDPIIPAQELRLHVTEYSKEYVDIIAGPDKLSLGDSVSESTHLSLVAGSVARNLVAIIGVHLYRRGKPYPEPYSEGVQKVVEALSKACRRPGCLVHELGTDQLKLMMGLIPLRSTGSVYVLLSLTRLKLYNPAETGDVKAAWTLISYVLRQLLGQVLKELASEPNTVVRLDVRLVNSTDGFIPSRRSAGDTIYRSVATLLRDLINVGVRVVFGYVLANTYHPAREIEGGSIRLVDLDEYGIIALAKIDADMMGEVRKFISFSPSRLVTLSDIVNTIIAGKVYMLAINIAERLRQRGELLDAIPLYAGGEDITMYGKWAHVVKLVNDVYSSVRESTKPLTMSLAVAIDRETAPILELYERTVSLLEGCAKTVKASGVIGERVPRILRTNGKEIVVDAIPLEEPTNTYPWPPDPASRWSLEVLAKIIDPLNMRIHEFEEYKHDLYMLLTIGAELQELIERGGYKGLDQAPLQELLRLEIAYAYIWGRRGEALREVRDKLNKVSQHLGDTLIIFPDETRVKGVREALRLLLALKPMIDYLMLALRRKDTVKPSSIKPPQQTSAVKS